MNIETSWPGDCPTKQTALSTSGWHRRRLLTAPEGHFPERRKRVWQSGHHERYGDTAGSAVFFYMLFHSNTWYKSKCCSLDSRLKVALVSGLCTAGGAYAPTMSDVAVITHRIGRTCWTFLSEEMYWWFLGNIYLGGPPLVKAATGEVVTGEELGGLDKWTTPQAWMKNIICLGATMHCSVSGITDHFAKDEEESFAITRWVRSPKNCSSIQTGMWSPPWISHQLRRWNWKEHHLYIPLRAFKFLLARMFWRRRMSWHSLPESLTTAGEDSYLSMFLLRW